MTTDNQRMSNKHEAEVAEAFGGQVTPMSGAGWVSKGDVHTAAELIECKATKSQSYSVKHELLLELEHEANVAGKTGVLSIKFAFPAQGRPRRYVLITEEDYLEQRGKLDELLRRVGEHPDYCPEKNWCEKHKAFGVHDLW